MDINGLVYSNKDIIYSNTLTIPQYSVGIVTDIQNNGIYVTFKEPQLPVKVESTLLTEFNPQKTGDDFSEKICNRCHRLLPVSYFEKNQNAKDNKTRRRPTCRECRKDIDGKSLSSKEKQKAMQTKPYMQWWTCPICKKQTIPGLTSKIVLDHDHETGQVRTWICDSCNTGLGRFQEKTSILQNVINYLKQYQEERRE